MNCALAPGSSTAPSSAVQRGLKAEFLKGLDGANLVLVTGAYQPRLSPCGSAGRGRESARVCVGAAASAAAFPLPE